IGFSTFASLGSMIDIDFGDMIDFLGDDDHTRSILLNMEHIHNAKKFVSAARGFARSKPIIVLKSGRYPESVTAASPVGQQPGDDRVYEAAFKRVGVVRVEEAKDLFNAAQVLDANYLPGGSRLAVVGNAGTVGALATDRLIESGGVLAELSAESLTKLHSVLPPHWSRKNPVDLGGDADAERYAKAIDLCLQDSSVDALLVIHTAQGNMTPADLATAITGVPNAVRKPIIVTLMGGPEVKNGMAILHSHNIPAYGTPEAAVRACLQMFKYRGNLELMYETPADFPIDQAPPKHYLKTFVQKAVKEGTLALTPEESMSFLINYGIPFSGTVMSATFNEVLPVALKVGFPITLSSMPGRADRIKKEQIDVRTVEELEEALEALKRKISAAPEHTYLETVAVRPMLKEVDYIFYLTMTRDVDFNSVIRFGLGGMGRDIFKDCAIGLPPLNQMLARRLIEESKAFEMLQGYLGRKPLDILQLELVLVSFSNLVVDFPEIAAVDIDPLVFSNGKLSALDARIYLDPNAQPGPTVYPHLAITPYPTRYIKPWRLKDGTEVLLRPVRPEDEPMLSELFNSLSKQTMIERFFSPIKNMTHEMLTRFCNIDYDREIAIVACRREGDKTRIIGISDLIIEQNARAQFAVLIQDAYQAKGLGQKLIDVLIGIGQEKGLEAINGVVLADNAKMLKLVKRLGFKEIHSAYGTTEIMLKLK
ncbi:MAG: GNAT family N-acetyltransferase, partial [Desulfobacteraceae bacterium]